jgi:hypothetical protein
MIGRSLLVLCCFAPAVSLAAPTSPQQTERAAGVVSPAPMGDPKDAPAVADVKADFIILHATNDGKGIDPGIGKMPELEAPFRTTLQVAERSAAQGRGEGKKLPTAAALMVQSRHGQTRTTTRPTQR